MQKRMRGAHPRTPGGRAPAPKGGNSQPQAGSYTKFMPVQAPKRVAKPAPTPAPEAGDSDSAAE